MEETLQRWRPLLEEAVDHALLSGLLKITASGALQHAPFALNPCPAPAAAAERMAALAAPYNRLVLRVSRAREFVTEVLAGAARTDDFTGRLLEMARNAGRSQPIHFSVSRSDYFLHLAPGAEEARVKQVEMNTISASYPGLAALTQRLHAFLMEDPGLESPAGKSPLLSNDPIPTIAGAFAAVQALYGHPGAIVLMVVQPGETNRFDQRLLEFALRARGMITRRMTLEEIAAASTIREGHLMVNGELASIVYFRAAYGPEDFTTAEAFQARERIEASSAVSVPCLYTQLAGTKKIQQALTDPVVLRRFLAEPEAVQVEASFAGQFELDQHIAAGDGGGAGQGPAWEIALADPGGYVLKPQREGGGHNFFDGELVERLRSMEPGERSAYVLMERLLPAPHPALLVQGGQAREVEAVSEIGFFGVCAAENEAERINTSAGYLVRTKAQGTLEGGVSAGYGYLDSLLLT